MNGYLDHLVNRALDAAPVLQPRLPSWFEPLARSAATLEEVTEEQVVGEMPAPPAMSRMSDRSREVTAQSHPQATPPRPDRSSEPAVRTIQQPVESREVLRPRVEREVRERRQVVVEQRIERRIEEMPAPPPQPAVPSARRVEPREPADRAEQLGNRHRAAQAVQTAPLVAPILRPASASAATNAPIATPAAAERPVNSLERESPPPAVATLVPKPGPMPAALPLARPEVRPERPHVAPWPAAAALVPKRVPMPAAVPAARANPSLTRSSEPISPTVEGPLIRVSIGRVEVRAVSAPAPAAAARRPCSAPMLSLDEYLKQKDGRTP